MIELIRRLNAARKWRRRARAASRRREALAAFGACAKGVYVRGKRGEFVVDPEDGFVGKALLTTGEYNDWEFRLISSLIPSNARILVVGTHIGALAVPLAKICEWMCAIEANPHTFALLSANLRLNSCHNVVAHNVAAAEAHRRIEFIMSRDNSGGSKRMPAQLRTSYIYDEPDIIEIEAVPLDDLLCGNRFDLVFMDIEGSEYFALCGMQTILASATKLVVEFVPDHIRDVGSVSIEQFLSAIRPHFSWMYDPATSSVLSDDRIWSYLTALYNDNEVRDELVFAKSPLEINQRQP